MFKRISIYLTDPICPCEEQKLSWTVKQTEAGPSLSVWCNSCGTSVLVPNAEFKASFTFDRPYPGKPKPKVPVVTHVPGPGDVVDITEYLRKKREREPAS